MQTLRLLCCVAVALMGLGARAGGASTQPAVEPLLQTHAHNDYLHERPLLDALEHGFCSVEADIHLVDGKLLVAHDRSQTRPDRTLQALYLDPLRERAKQNGGRVYRGGPELTLLIDLKADWHELYPVLHAVLTNYADILTTFRGGQKQTNAVMVVISGNRSRDMLAGEAVRYAALDGELTDLDNAIPADMLPWMSTMWGRSFKWRGKGAMPAQEFARLKEIVAKAHGQGRRVRFWGAPDSPACWTVLRDAGVDLINTDDLAGLEKFLRAPAAEPVAYLFTYFTKNGEDGLHLAWSADGYKWAKLGDGKSYLTPTVGRSKLMRDPCVTRGPDGTFHMVWTSGWTENDIGHASTKDFLTWSPQQEIPVMAHEPAVRNTWAPEIHYDDQRGEFIIFWASTIPGRFAQTAESSESKYNHRMYCTTTKDFVTFAPTKLFYDPGFSVIDATFLHADGRHWLVLKDETLKPPKKYLQVATAETLQGPFGALSQPITPPGVWAEGPTALKIGADYLIYFDAYRNKHYGAMRSRDLKMWEDVTAQMTFPDEGTPLRPRHGTIIAVPQTLIERLRGVQP